MDDLNIKLEEILNDPESMKKVRIMAESLLGEDSEDSKNNNKSESHNSTSPSDFADMGQIMNIIKAMDTTGNDNRTKLLLALKPHLSGKRRAKVDSAIKLLKLIEMLPLLKETGILDLG